VALVWEENKWDTVLGKKKGQKVGKRCVFVQTAPVGRLESIVAHTPNKRGHCSLVRVSNGFDAAQWAPLPLLYVVVVVVVVAALIKEKVTRRGHENVVVLKKLAESVRSVALALKVVDL
jgi:hypothetical protein